MGVIYSSVYIGTCAISFAHNIIIYFVWEKRKLMSEGLYLGPVCHTFSVHGRTFLPGGSEGPLLLKLEVACLYTSRMVSWSHEFS